MTSLRKLPIRLMLLSFFSFICTNINSQDGKYLYDYADDFSEGLAVVMKNGKCGVIDKTGKSVVPFDYDFIWGYHSNRARVIKYWDEKKNKLNQKELDNSSLYSYYKYSNYQNTEDSCYYGFIDHLGKVIIPLEYDYASDFHDGYSIVSKNGKYGLIDIEGNIVIPIIYDRIFDTLFYVGMDNNLIGAETDGKIGFINILTGKNAIPFEFDHMQEVPFFSEGLAAVKNNKKYIFIDTIGNIKIPTEWDYASNFNKGFALVRNDACYYLINDKGDITRKIGNADDITVTSNQQIIVVKKRNKNWEIYDGNDQTISELDYSYVSHWINDLFIVSTSGNTENKRRFGCIDKKGNVIVPIKYNDFYPYSDGYIIARKNKRWYCLQVKGNKISAQAAIPRFCQVVDYFHEGMARIVKRGKYGFINTNGKIVIPTKYENARSFYEGMVAVQKNGKWGFVDIKGNEL